jgi:hypothetical protein
MKQVLGLAVKDSRKSWLANVFAPKSAFSLVINSLVQPRESRSVAMQCSPLKEVSVKLPCTLPVSKLRVTARPRMQPKSRTASKPRVSSCRRSVTEFWAAPTTEFLSLCLPLEA